MSSNTWTRAALSSDAQASSGTCWRLVEAQHHISTLKLVDRVDEQEALEELIETSKPIVPLECRHLDYLLSTPFRYGALYPRGSRFRRPGMTEGVYYASEAAETAVAEVAFYRLLFYSESPDTPWPANPAEYTAFAAEYVTKKSIDLSQGRYARTKTLWMNETDYSHCQDFCDVARSAEIEMIRYVSVRDPENGMNLALLRCRVFAKQKPVGFQTWRIRLSDAGVLAVCDAPRSRFTYGRGAFATDPRIAKLRWKRT
jgi:RES domain